MSARPSSKAAGERGRRRSEERGSEASRRPMALPIAHVGLARVGAVSLLTVVLRYSRAPWAQWVSFDAPTGTFGRALLAAAGFFGGVPRRFVFEEPDCRVLHWDGHGEHFALLLQAVARHLGSELALWHERWCGPATRAGERLIWATVCPKAGELGEANAALRVALERAMRLPHPHEPDRSIAEVFGEERGQLSPFPAPSAGLERRLEAEGERDA